MPPWMTGPTVDWRTGGEGRSEERERQAEEKTDYEVHLKDTPLNRERRGCMLNSR